MTGPSRVLTWGWRGDTVVGRVTSRSHPDRVHDVQLASDGSSLGCSCPAHPRFGCHHLDALREAVIQGLARAALDLTRTAEGLPWVDQAPYLAAAGALAYQARGFRDHSRGYRATAVVRAVGVFGEKGDES